MTVDWTGISHWRFHQASGKFCGVFEDGAELSLCVGWAGHGAGRNNPAAQGQKDVGPLPRGWYTIQAPHENPKTGPYTMNLLPWQENEMFGRGDFRIHGAAFKNPELSSDGCIILPRDCRETVWNSAVHKLQVTE